jgi:DNA recombination protein RmuC
MGNLVIVAAIALVAGALVAWVIRKLLFERDHVPAADLRNAADQLAGKEKDHAVLLEKFQALSDSQVKLADEHQALQTNFRELSDNNARNEERIISLTSDKNNSLDLLTQRDESLEKGRLEIAELNAKLTRQEAQLKYQAEQQEKYLRDLETMNTRLKNEFEVLAQEVLDKKSQKFTDLNAVNLKGILEPLKEQLNQFKVKVEETYDKESKQRFSLENEIKKLVDMSQKVSDEANNLTKALKGDVKKQGDWGEMILESVLERSGLVKDREYFLQETLKDDEGRVIKNEAGQAMRPDVTIYYPDKRCLILDAKVSLNAYERFANADDPDQQEAELKAHIQSLRAHIDGLSARRYHAYIQSLDWVVMFVPIEPAYLVALRKDPELWQYAYSRRIILVCPSNLLAVLKITADLWKREYQNRNALEIAERGGRLYDKFVNFVSTMTELGGTIQKAHATYDKAYAQLTTGPGNLVRQADQLKQLGVKAEKQLPKNLTEAEGDTPPLLPG